MRGRIVFIILALGLGLYVAHEARTPTPTTVTDRVTSSPLTCPPPVPPVPTTEQPLPAQFAPQRSRGIAIPVDFVYHNRSESTAIKSETFVESTACVAFFGLVKSMSDPQLERYARNIIDPLRSAGLRVAGFLHTFNMSMFSNPRNAELAERLDQQGAIDKIAGLFSHADSGESLFEYVVDDARLADAFYGPVARYLRHGNPWPENNETSVMFLLRQQFSLLRLTEMWAGVNLTADKQSAVPTPLRPRIRIPQKATGERHALGKCDCVLVLRPDLLIGGRLPAKTIEFLCRRNAASIHRSLHAAAKAASHESGSKELAADSKVPRQQWRHQDVMIPRIEHGGYNDRFAFATPLAALRYGARGLVIDAYINSHQPHAETFLGHFLCENRIAVHLLPMYVRRLRGIGYYLPYNGKSEPRWRTEDYDEAAQREHHREHVATSFVRWHKAAFAVHSQSGKPDDVLSCPPVGAWNEALDERY